MFFRVHFSGFADLLVECHLVLKDPPQMHTLATFSYPNNLFFVRLCKYFFFCHVESPESSRGSDSQLRPAPLGRGRRSQRSCLSGHVLQGPDSPGSDQDEWALCCPPSSPAQALGCSAGVRACVCMRACMREVFVALFVLQRCALAASHPPSAPTPRPALASKQPNQTELLSQKQIAVRRPFTGLNRAFRGRNVAPVPIHPPTPHPPQKNSCCA